MSRAATGARSIVIASSVVLLACGCTNTASIESVGKIQVIIGRAEDDAADALLSGVLEVVDGCLGIDGSVVVWPHDTKVTDRDPLTIKVPRQGTFRVGDRAQVGGGFFREASPAATATGGVTAPSEEIDVGGVLIPSSCSTRSIFIAG